MIPYLITDKSVTAYLEGKPFICSNEHLNYYKIIEKLKNNDIDNLANLFSIEKSINQISNKIKIIDGVLYYLDKELHNSLVLRILSMLKQDFDIQFMIKFLENLLDNPNKNAIDELYDFMSYGNLPITTDGCFLAYKKVRNDFFDIHSNTINNNVGEIIKMNREDVDDNKDETCSSGLHFCSYEYLKSFGNSKENKVVVLKINPRDVVSIPTDYNNTKGRCCKYEVLEDITDNYLINIDNKTTKLENSIVYKTEEELLIDVYFSEY